MKAVGVIVIVLEVMLTVIGVMAIVIGVMGTVVGIMVIILGDIMSHDDSYGRYGVTCRSHGGS